MKKPHAIIKAKQKAAQLLQANLLPQAQAAFERICRQAPADYEAWLNLGAIAGMLGNLEAAEAAFRRVLLLNARLPQAQLNLARLLVLQNRLREALPHYQHYLVLKPAALDGHYQLGHLYEALGEQVEAEKIYRAALLLDEQDAGIHIGLARLLRVKGEYAAATEQCERALQLNGNAALAYFELGHIHKEQRRFDEALRCYQQLVALAPQERESYLLSLGALYAEQERYAEAMQCYQQLLAVNPEAVNGHWNRSLLLLLAGQFTAGWQEYEWRQQSDDWLRQMWPGEFSQPRWAGEPLNGRTILVYAEQGFRDTIQFGRYLPLLIAQGARVIFHCMAELAGVYSRMPGFEVVVRDYDKAQQQSFDFHIALMSLPHIMGTTLENIPAAVPYLHADVERVAAWRERINGGNFKIGLVWAGAAKNVANRMRSTTLAAFASLAAIPDVTIYSLQKEAAAGSELIEQWGLVDLGPALHDFDDTAAAIANLDLVISVDTSVAHLAGALGVPVWILIYSSPEWRWLLERDDSPWYPTARLFRQSLGQPWPQLIERVAAALSDLRAGHETNQEKEQE